MNNQNISGVEAIRQLIEAQKNWHVFRAKKEDDKNTIYIGDTPLTEEELVNIKSGGNVDEKIGDIETALDTILAIQRQLMGIEEITFTIGEEINYSQEYRAVEGMTWGEWINTEYNTIGITSGNSEGVNVGQMYLGVSGLVYNGNNVLETDIIIAGEFYRIA